MVTVAAHVKILITEGIERCSEYLRIKESVLREHIHLAVRDDRTRKEQLVFRLIADVVHSLALGGSVLLQFVSFVRDHQVGVICQQFFFEPPRTFVIHDHYLQALVRQLGQLLLFLCRCTFEDRQRIWEVGELFKFLFPDAKDGKRRYYQHTVDLAVLVHTSRHGNAHDCFAGTHFHQECRASALKTLVKYTELIADECKGSFLMVIRRCLDRHHQFDILIHCRHPAFP